MDATASQTVGPFFNRDLFGKDANDLTASGGGEVIEIEGQVLATPGDPVGFALVEIWQADPAGRFNHPADNRGGAAPGFRGFAQTLTDSEGWFRFRTLKPGPVPHGGNAWQAPHINLSVFAAGLLQRLVTRLYFPDEPANAADPLLSSIAEPDARATLIATTGDGPGRLRFNVVLQGDGAGQFFTL